MNPYPLFTLNHFTVPVTLVAERKQLKHQNYNYMKTSALVVSKTLIIIIAIYTKHYNIHYF
jgi:hypothetical protein